MGLGTNFRKTGIIASGVSPDSYYDVTGHEVCDLNGTGAVCGGACNVDASSRHIGQIFIRQDGQRAWVNDTDYLAGWKFAAQTYPIYDTNTGADYNRYSAGFDVGGSIGLIAIVIAFIVVATIAGIRFFGAGESEFSVETIVKAGALIAIWTVFSFASVVMITAVPLLGPIFYFFLTAVYTLGIVNAVGHPGEE